MTNLMLLMKLRHAAFLLFLLLSFAIPNALAKGPSAMKAEKGEIQSYLHGKYKIKEILIQEGEDTHNGLGRWRSLLLGGETWDNDITPPSLAAQGDRASKHLRTIAKAFLAEEADLFGLTPISEMREVSIEVEVRKSPPYKPNELGVYTRLSYYHYLNGLKLAGTEIGMNIGPTGKLSNVYAHIVDITPQLLKAVETPDLPTMEIRRVIKKDLIAHGENPNSVTNLTDEKYAIPIPPYVVWKVSLSGDDIDATSVLPRDYMIDAFTGQIMSKDSPCDRVGSCMPDTDSPVLKIIDSISKEPIKNTPVRIYSDNGMRCIREPCNTNGISWEGKTDAHGVLIILGTVAQYSMHLSVSGYRGSDLQREAKAEARGRWSITVDADRRN